MSQKTQSGIIIPEAAQRKTNRGKVVGVGQNVQEVKIGDTVHFGYYAADQRMPDDEKDLCIVTEHDIIAVER